MEKNIKHPVSKFDSKPRLRIAQIAPLYEQVPPKLYGGTERSVSYITEELVRRGHDVTLFASGDSKTAAHLSPGCPRALRLEGRPEMGTFLQLPMLSDVYRGAHERFDIIHSHIDYWAFAFAELVDVPTVGTMHGRLDIDELRPIYSRYREVPIVSISDSQRLPLPFMNWVATVYHGLPRELLKPSYDEGKYLAFLGRISPEKRPDLAIEVARKAGIPIKIAAKVDVVDKAYFETVIKPLLAPPDVEYIGEIGEHEKSEFLGNAIALTFTIDWPEPFGLAMIEAMACGTPVLARPCGSVPEVVDDGVTGFIAKSTPDLIKAVRDIQKLSRKKVRERFEQRFTADVMADQYEEVFRALLSGEAKAERRRAS